MIIKQPELFMAHRPSLSTHFQYNGKQDLEILLNNTCNTSTLNITNLCDHIVYNYGIPLDYYQYQRHPLCFNGVLKFPQVMTIKLH